VFPEVRNQITSFFTTVFWKFWDQVESGLDLFGGYAKIPKNKRYRETHRQQEAARKKAYRLKKRQAPEAAPATEPE